MVSTFTPNIQIEEPGRGDDVGIWDTPVNNNSTLLDLVAGGTATITLNNANITLSAAQFQSKTITFSSTLTGSVTITFPTSFKKSYEIFHTCTGSSAFTITLTTTAANSLFICAVPGEIVDIVNDGGNLRYKNLGRVGEYVDIAGSSMPNWITGCGTNNVGFAPLPYLNCDGSGFLAATYPQLAVRLGGTTLPDARGRMRMALDQGVGRVSSAASGVAGNTLLTGGGDQMTQQHNHAITDPTHAHNQNASTILSGAGSPAGLVTGGSGAPIQVSASPTQAAATGISVNNAGSGAAQNMPPLLVAGLTMIRAG